MTLDQAVACRCLHESPARRPHDRLLADDPSCSSWRAPL